MRIKLIAALAALTSIGAGGVAPAAPLSVLDSFRIGNSGTVYCSAQNLSVDKALTGMFDAGYSVTCRDAALPVGKLYKLRSPQESAARLAALRGATADCTAPHSADVPNLGSVEVVDCKLKDADVAYRAYQLVEGGQLYAAEGLAGYDSALQLGLRSLVGDAPVKGEVSIATTGAGDPAAFARVQAGTLDPSRALAEAYRRNNAGSYAEAAEFFAAVINLGEGPLSHAEALANEALQKSNLGRYSEADSLFARAAEQLAGDPLVARRLRNYRAIHQLNRGNANAALQELDKPVPKAPNESSGAATGPVISAVVSKRLNSQTRLGEQLAGSPDELGPAEKAEILDGQALQLRGTSLRLKGDLAQASAALRSADSKLQSVREGRVASVMWMRAQILGDLAAIAEDQKNMTEADRLYREGVALLEANYPGSAALLSSKARLAGYLARTGQSATAEAMFREIVHSQPDTRNLPPSFANVLRPYVDLLLAKTGDPAATAEIFAATQLMVRTGLAQTQAVLARELSGGTDEASRLFRQSVTLTRQAERARIELARVSDIADPTPEQQARARMFRAALDQSQKEQLATQSALASFPRYRAVSDEVIPLAELQKTLRPGEAYYRMTTVGDDVYALLVNPAGARAAKLGVTAAQLAEQVKSLRETISTVENGDRITYEFDVALSHQIYGELFGPFGTEIAAATHLIFEPDGAMLRLPPNLLVMDQASVDLNQQRVNASRDGPVIDFRGIAWLGRDRDISTAVSPRSFAQLRNAPPSAARHEYLGLGQNTPPSAAAAALVPAAADRDCTLSISTWDDPISAKELQVASAILQPYDPSGVQVVTGDEFTDTALGNRSDLDQYRIIHFATHGVVTSRAAKCPAQPALLTSFGGSGSDGLLTFKDVFDLHLDADVIILSACDTASQASAAATQQAGLATGGDVALDGLVRAFVGAGGRLVIASHWPIPDNYDATQRLMTGLFSASPGTPTVTALRLSQRQLMDDVNTSHPFYWSAFAAVGDGEIPLIRKNQQIAAK
ncbi:MAG TPA: CHAT domain-containing protein [Sphingomicrobium sp.]|nr:CHAT domain-containing protein [Sphingomicrobium sp.]